MKKYYIAALVLVSGVLVYASKKTSDPVLLTVADKEVTLSEFEYLYHKNNAQQLQPQTLDEYVEMFADYKRKVVAAEAEGLDTTASFRKEYNQFCDELSAPYLKVQAVEDSLVAVAYSHDKEDVLVSHIMFGLGKTPQQASQAAHLADSVRTQILNGDITFEDAARRYSIDNPSKARGGLMGMVVPGRFPWTFEDAAYNTAAGELSPVVNSGFGLHIIRVEKRTPSKGQVNASHILKLTRGKSEAEAEQAKAAIDSIYNVLISNPQADFGDIAKRESEDPGSARKGGSLGWFSSGQMVAEFDSVAFALADSAVSAPFKTSFGYHIVKRLGHRTGLPYEERKAGILKQMQSDERGRMAQTAKALELIAQYNGSVSEASIAAIVSATITNTADSAAVAQLKANTTDVLAINGKSTTMGEVAKVMPPIKGLDAAAATEIAVATANSMLQDQAMAIGRDNLMVENTEYRNLMNEYRDGILLFEISNRNVWEKATKEKEALENYFKAHRSDYTWDKPKFKSYIIFTTTDSLKQEIQAYVNTLGKVEDHDAFVQDLRKRFGVKKVKVERVIAAKGENAITDYLAFGGEKPQDDSKQPMKSYFAFQGRIIDQPEEAIDVRGQVVTDYQAALEKEWLEQLRAKYPLKVNEKVLKKVK